MANTTIGTTPSGMAPEEWLRIYTNLVNSYGGGYAGGNTETLEGLNTMLFGPRTSNPNLAGPPAPPGMGKAKGMAKPGDGSRAGGGLVDKSVAEMRKIMAADPKEEQKTLQQYYKTAQKMYDTQRAETEAKTMAMQQDALMRAKQFDLDNLAVMQGTVGNVAWGGQMQQLQRPPAYSGDLLSGEKMIGEMGFKGAQDTLQNQQEAQKMMEIAKRADAANRVAMFNTTMSAAANIAGKGVGQQKALDKALANALPKPEKPTTVLYGDIAYKKQQLEISKELDKRFSAGDKIQGSGPQVKTTNKDGVPETVVTLGGETSKSALRDSSQKGYVDFYNWKLKTANQIFEDPNFSDGNISVVKRTPEGKMEPIRISKDGLDFMVKNTSEQKIKESGGTLYGDALYEAVMNEMKKRYPKGLGAQLPSTYIEAWINKNYPPPQENFPNMEGGGAGNTVVLPPFKLGGSK